MRKIICLLLIGATILAACGSAMMFAVASNEATVASRYHLRNRTSNFYRRARAPQRKTIRRASTMVEPVAIRDAGEQVASRYHLRKRSSNFYRRSTRTQSRRMFA